MPGSFRSRPELRRKERQSCRHSLLFLRTMNPLPGPAGAGSRRTGDTPPEKLPPVPAATGRRGGSKAGLPSTRRNTPRRNLSAPSATPHPGILPHIRPELPSPAKSRARRSPHGYGQRHIPDRNSPLAFFRYNGQTGHPASDRGAPCRRCWSKSRILHRYGKWSRGKSIRRNHAPRRSQFGGR